MLSSTYSISFTLSEPCLGCAVISSLEHSVLLICM